MLLLKRILFNKHATCSAQRLTSKVFTEHSCFMQSSLLSRLGMYMSKSSTVRFYTIFRVEDQGDVSFFPNDVENSKIKVLNEFRRNRANLAFIDYIDIKMYLILELGLAPAVVADLAKDNEDIFSLKVDEVQAFVQLLHVYGFDRAQIKHTLFSHPWVMLIPIENVAKTLDAVMRDIEITRAELPQLCVNAPCVFADSPTAQNLLEKHYFFRFVVRLKDFAGLVSSGTFKYSMNHIKQRYEFLFRRGQYAQANRHGSSNLTNNSLSDIFGSGDQEFCNNVAKCAIDEYELFKRLLAIEEQLKDETLKEETTIIEVYGKRKIVDVDHDINKDVGESKGIADELSKYL